MYNYNISKVKTIAAFAVVLIHSTAFLVEQGTVNFANYYWYRPLLNFAVPIFFAVSGYLIAVRGRSYVHNYKFKILKMYIVWSIFYVVFNIITDIITNLIINKPLFTEVFNMFSFRGIAWIFMGIIGEAHLWYLWATFLGLYILELLIEKRLSDHKIFYTSIVIFIVITILREVPILGKVFYAGSFAKAFSFISLGILAKKSNKTIRYPLVFALFFIGIYTLLFYIVGATSYLDLLLLPGVYFIIIYLSNHNGNKSTLSELGRYTTDIYIYHIAVLTMFELIILLFPNSFLNYSGIRIFISSILMIGIPIIMGKTMNNYLIKPIEKFIATLFNKIKW